jgi:signal recognition particle subunit SEC65
MNCIKNIGLTYTVIAHDAVNPRRKFNVGLAVILEVGKQEFFKVHFQARGSG